MIRFVDLKDQITCDGTHEFAWFDTITDSFICLNGVYTWQSWIDFEQDYDASYDEDFIATHWPIERFERLFQWRK